MPSDLDTAVRVSKRLEALLAARHGATGRGLHEKVDSVRAELAPETVRDLRLVATVRNRIVHEEGYDRIDGRRSFLEAARRAERALGGRRMPVRAVLIVSAAMFAVLAAVGLVLVRLL